ncbi:MAG: hypothetical protein ACOC58_00090 [Chloroflexota bacterium]
MWYLIAQFSSLEELGTVAPLEEGQPEGALMLMGLEFAAAPDPAVLAQFEESLTAAGVPCWPGQGYHVSYQDGCVQISWVKGMAWLPLILGILLPLVLPALLGGVIWMLIPEEVKDLLNMMVVVGIMLLAVRAIS